MNKIYALLILLHTLPLSAQTLEERYQADASVKRVADVHVIADLVLDYRNATGVLPFAEDYSEGGFIHVVPIGTLPAIATDRERGSPFGVSMRKYPALELLSELESALDRDLTLPVDPQKVPTTAPNLYYLFLLENNEFVILTFLYDATPHTVEVAPHVNIYALGSASGMEFMTGLGLNIRDITTIPATERAEIAEAGFAINEVFARTTTIEIDN